MFVFSDSDRGLPTSLFPPRLEKMRDAIDQQHHDPKEITVKTSRGEEFKFGGISEKFTKKLYEWEEQKGIAPESSTIALLNPNYNQQGESGQLKEKGEIAKGKLLLKG